MFEIRQNSDKKGVDENRSKSKFVNYFSANFHWKLFDLNWFTMWKRYFQKYRKDSDKKMLIKNAKK